ncbi:segregation/condensation protein A [Auritidibacter sp. NML100628]|nr:segregation/condensation protein A [Auritidibacter sp. NML100628]
MSWWCTVSLAELSGDALTTTAHPEDSEETDHGGFQLHLKNFEGPFDLLLSLIARKRLEVTEVALAEVTDEFLAYVRTIESTVDALDETSSFMVVAATLLDLKTARLLPAGISDPDEELALLEERDLLFARLLQYKAFKQAAALMTQRMAENASAVPRRPGPEPAHTHFLPPLVLNTTVEEFAQLAQQVFSRTPVEDGPDQVGTDHLHSPVVSVWEQVSILSSRLAQAGRMSFTELVADADNTMTVVARFLGLLELYRDRLIFLEQDHPLDDIQVQWHPERDARLRPEPSVTEGEHD